MSQGQFKLLLLSLVITQLVGFSALGFILSNPSSGPNDARILADAINAQLRELAAVRDNAQMTGGRIAASVPDAEAVRAVVRSALEQELGAWVASHPAAGGVAQGQARTPLAEAPPNESQELAMDESREVMRAAISAGRWTLADTERVAGQTAHLTQAQRIELLEAFHDALNQNALVLEGPPPPL